jgi:ABC-type uncharacterized transport system ATPase subunit
MSPILKMENIVKIYDSVTALDGINLFKPSYEMPED